MNLIVPWVIMENVCDRMMISTVSRYSSYKNHVFNFMWKSVCITYAYMRVKVTLRNIVEPHVFLFLSERIPFVSSDFGRTRRTSLVEIVKVSRDTMNYSCRGETQNCGKLSSGEANRSSYMYTYMSVCVRTRRVYTRVSTSWGSAKTKG